MRFVSRPVEKASGPHPGKLFGPTLASVSASNGASFARSAPTRTAEESRPSRVTTQKHDKSVALAKRSPLTEVKKALALMQCAIYSGAMSQPDRAKPELFLCHSGKDKTYVRRLASDLEMLGVEPWFDAWQLSVGDSLIKRIGDGIGTSKFFCIILSVNSKGSRWCDAELSEALSLSIERGKRNILVVKKGKVDIPRSFEITVTLMLRDIP